MNTDWKATGLWQSVSHRLGSTDPLYTFTCALLDRAQLLLNKAGTIPLNFTLHDADHSFRVAEKMHLLIPQQMAEEMSTVELALLLQSAYLHDIGMNPAAELVGNIANYLRTGEEKFIAEDELKPLRRWLDEQFPDETLPVRRDSADQREAWVAHLTAYYARYRHNDWSAPLIMDLIETLEPPYPNWTTDITQLCQSHHYGYDRLISAEYDARIVHPDQILNMRYLAACLRVADVLDFDPERTPEIILKHRAISEKSVLYWVKDHAINLVVEPDIWLIAVHAQTKTAWVHNAVLQTAADIDRELTLCSSIAGEGGFAAKPALGSKAAYAWPWPTTVKKVVEALPNTFVYIDASFKPDSQRLLGLLAGTQLYSSPFAAVRELVQNAFDAVREQIALELLGVDPGVRGEKRSALQSIHQITLSTAEKRDGLWITCSDDGVGMTREVIQHHLLVGGSRARTEIADLRRRCQAEGIEFYRSGEFGIGILSYFMIADRLQVETRAGWEAHSQHENSGWRFETEGLDGFGELRRIAKQSRGTVVSLRVRPDREADVRAGLKDFLARQIRKVPCSFSLQIDGVSNFAPGWMPVPDFGDFLFAATSRSNRSSTGWISKNAREESLREKRLANELKVDAVSKLRFHRSEIISLPHGRGQMRMTVPYFIHEGHVSPVFLARDGDNVLSHRANLRGFKLTTRPMVSWRGFATSPAYDRISSSDDDDTEGLEMDSRFFVLTEYVPDEVDAAVLIEVDFITDATVSVDRSELRILAKEEIDGFIRARRLRYLHDFLREFQDSPSLVYRQYWAAALAGLGGYKPSSFQWFFANETDSRSITVRPIRFPAVYYTARPSYSPLPVLPTSNDMRFADFLFDVEGPAGTLTPLLETHPSRALIAVGQYGTTPLMVFDQPLVPREGQPSTCDFPPGWESLLCVSASGLQTRTFFNRGNPIVKATREINWSDERIDSEKLRALVHSEISLETAARIVLDSGDEDDEFWNALRDTHLDLYSKIWKALAAIGIQQIITWRAEQFADLTMLIVSETGAEFRTYSPDDVFGPFPTPDANWILETEAFDPSM